MSKSATPDVGDGSISIGVDVGGTFTDLVVYNSRTSEVRTAKLLTTPRDITAGIFQSFDQVGVNLAETAYVKHGTTTAINTALERSGARTALITTRGFRDSLELGRGNRPEFIQPVLPPHAPAGAPQSSLRDQRAHGWTGK